MIEMFNKRSKKKMKKVLVSVSARHLHVTAADLAALFGEGFELSNKKDLIQPGQFATNERVTVVGPKGEIAGVSILGPVRPATQVELSLTDARKLGLAAPVRESGMLAGSPGCKLIGPVGEVEITEGVIAAKRHVHLSPAQGAEFGLKDRQVVEVKITTADRTTTFGDVVVRVDKNYTAEMHVDTDEANAAGCSGEVWGEILG